MAYKGKSWVEDIGWEYKLWVCDKFELEWW